MCDKMLDSQKAVISHDKLYNLTCQKLFRPETRNFSKQLETEMFTFVTLIVCRNDT